MVTVSDPRFGDFSLHIQRPVRDWRTPKVRSSLLQWSRTTHGRLPLWKRYKPCIDSPIRGTFRLLGGVQYTPAAMIHRSPSAEMPPVAVCRALRHELRRSPQVPSRPNEGRSGYYAEARESRPHGARARVLWKTKRDSNFLTHTPITI